ncbi:MAG: ATP synthase F1 subunit gamma [Bacteroidia bacterium]|jgi:F-type H+-transporting ATPase subunit gamma
MANLKEVRGRISSVMSTQQITKAMKMVSASKLRRAQNAITQIRPYTVKLKDIIDNLQSSMEGDMELSLAETRPVTQVAVVVVTSDKGLCGSFNSNLIKTARRLMDEQYAEQKAAGALTLIPVGKKGYDFFRKQNIRIDDRFVHLFNQLSFDKSSELSNGLINSFLSKEYDVIEVVYSEFKNPVVQFFKHYKFLPIQPMQAPTEKKELRHDYLLEPGKEEIIESLIPSFLKIEFHRALLDTNASEHGARMTSMDKATDNAGELLRDLRLQYNRARQAAITTEITEIVGGAAALEG